MADKVRDILGKPFVLLKYVDGSEFVVDHDFLYVREDTPNMLFMGGKHVDGTGFYAAKNRPTVGGALVASAWRRGRTTIMVARIPSTERV